MSWFRVDDGFGSHPKVLSIPRGAPRLRATGLWTAVGTWCAKHLTDGHFAAHMVEEHGGTKADARQLVAAGLWEVTDNGYVFHDYLDYNPSKEKVEAERDAAKERMRAARARRGGSPDVRANTEGTSGGVAVTPSRPVPTHAAAAASDQPPQPQPLPPPLEILRSKLEAARLVVRWDQLTSAQHTEIVELIDLHGDGPLVKSALTAHRPDSPAAFAQAWLKGWRALTPPGAGLRAAPDPACTRPGHQGTTRRCNQCAAEKLEEGAR